jgi:hypothetical protein
VNPTILNTRTTAIAFLYMLDDLEGIVDAGGFGEGFHAISLSMVLHSVKFVIMDRLGRNPLWHLLRMEMCLPSTALNYAYRLRRYLDPKVSGRA